MTYHGITLPHNDMVCGFDSFDVAWEVLVDLVCSISPNHDDLSGNLVWVDHFCQLMADGQTYRQVS